MVDGDEVAHDILEVIQMRRALADCTYAGINCADFQWLALSG